VTEAEFTGSYISFSELGGPAASSAELEAEISRWPLDGVLGFLATLSLEAVQAGQAFFRRRTQGPYLVGAIFDDFPRRLPRAVQMYVPGRPPLTGKGHIFIHEQNIAWLSHCALMHAVAGAYTPNLTYRLKCRMCRLLLIVNDIVNCGTDAVGDSLQARRTVCSDWLRHWQFNRFSNSFSVTLCKLARQHIIMADILPEFFPDVEQEFRSASGGIGLDRYFQILSLLVVYSYQRMRYGEHWLSADTLVSKFQANAVDVRQMLARWTRTPERYRRDYKKRRSSQSPTQLLAGFDYVLLRQTPLIQARPNQIVCPVMSFLLAKIEDEPYFLMSEHLGDRDRNRFQTALGEAYEQYAHQLLERMAKLDEAGTWYVQRRPITSGRELSDTYLQRGTTAIAVEHKALRAGTSFLRGGPGDRVLGPSQKILQRLDRGERVGLSAGRNSDNGLITRGMWQQSIHGAALVDWAERNIGQRPTRVFPVLTQLRGIGVDWRARKVYLEPLIRHANLYADSFWEPPQWAHVSDLEVLAHVIETQHEDLERILDEKKAYAPDQRFDVFLFSRFGSLANDKVLVERARQILGSAAGSFFPDDASQ